MLTIIAIVLALTVPFISRPSNTDPSHIFKKGVNNSIVTAKADAQALNIGISETTNDKFIIKNKYNTYNNDNTIDENNRSKTGIFYGILKLINNDSSVKVDKNGFAMLNNSAGNNPLFNASPEGIINIESTEINKNRYIRVGSTSAGSSSEDPNGTVDYIVPEDGFLYAANQFSLIINPSSPGFINGNVSHFQESNFYNTRKHTAMRVNSYETIDGNLRVTPFYTRPGLIPVQKDMGVHCTGWSNGDQWRCGFFPMQKGINTINQDFSGIAFYNLDSSTDRNVNDAQLLGQGILVGE